MVKKPEDMLSKIDGKLDDMSKTIHKIDKEVAMQKVAFEEHIKDTERMGATLEVNTASLQEHMHRTSLLEQIVQKMDQRLSPIEQEKIAKETIERYRKEMMVKWGKVFGLISAAGGALVYAKPFIMKLLMMLK